MVAAHRRHHRAAAIAGAHDGAAHRVPHIHKGERPRSVGADAFDRRAFGAEGREIVTDAAALLHGQRGLAQMREDPGHVVRDRPHDETVEERDGAAGASPGDDPAGGQKFEIGEGLGETGSPDGRVALGRGEGGGDPRPGILDGLVHSRAVRPFEPVFHVPDLLGDRSDACHGARAFRQKKAAPRLVAAGQLHRKH